MQENDLVIRPHGGGFIYIFLILSFFLGGGAASPFIVLFSSDPTVYHQWHFLIAGLACAGFSAYGLVQLFKKGKVVFKDNHFINLGKFDKCFPKIDRDCKDFVRYKLTAACFQFVFTDGKKVYFHAMQFTKKQNIRILEEIKKRGGFPDQEVKIERYYI